MLRVQKSESGDQVFAVKVAMRNGSIITTIIKVFYSVPKAIEYVESVNGHYSEQGYLSQQDG